MPNGSSGPGPPLPPPTPTSTTSHDRLDSSTTNITSSSPPRKFLLSGPKPKRTASVDDVNMKAKIFGGGNPPSSPTTTQRPRTGHQTIRGRISGPIPMPNPLDDDEFPMRNPGTGIASATPIESELAVQRQLQSSVSKPASPVTPGFAPAVAQTFPSAVAGNVRADMVVDVPQTVLEHLPSTPTQQQHPPSSAATMGGGGGGPSPEGGASSSVSATHSSLTKAAHRANVPSGSARYSGASANSQKTGHSSGNAPPVDGQPGQPQRKKSTLRSAIGKFLRRGRKKEGSLSSVSEVDRQAVLGGQQHHRSVPPAARNIPTQHLAPRVTSMPISEFDRALRSHSIGPDDINAIESARNSMDVLGSSPARKRAATLINTKIPMAGGMIPRSRGEEWAGLSPRPASTHGRGSRFTEEDPDAIGRAITSDGNGSDIGHKRRSRSLSQLNEVALEQQAGGRRRSDEIRYWRESYDIPGPLSPLSSAPNETETEVNEENYELGGGGGRVSMSVADSSVAERIPKTPPQPFHFGSVASMNEMAGMKITQAVTLEERFGNLEVRMIKLERVVDQLCHSVPGFKGPLKTTTTELGSAPSMGRQRSGSASASAANAGVPTRNVSVSQPTFAYSNVVPPMIPAIYQTASPGPPSSSRDDGMAGGIASSRFATNSSSRRSVETTGTTDDNNTIASSRMSFGDGHTYMDSLHPPSSSATQAVSTIATSVPPVPALGDLLRPTSENTVRPATSMPSLGSQQGGEERSSNSAALLAQLDQERAQRQLLEDQVRKLSERMNNLSTTMFAMVRDPAKTKSNERLRPQTANSSSNNNNTTGNTTQATTTTTRPTMMMIAPSSKAQSIFGKESVPVSTGVGPLMYHGGNNSMANSPSKEDETDDQFSDSAFQTPREEPTPGGLTYSQAFGDEFGGASPTTPTTTTTTSGYLEGGGGGGGVGETEEDLEARKKAARTLSLSQLTMGKGVPTRI